MTLPVSEVNFLAVLVAALVNFMLGGLWYSPLLFGRKWMEEVKLPEEGVRKTGEQVKAFLGTFACAFIAATFIALFIILTQSFGAFAGGEMGFLIATGFITTSVATNFFFEKRTRRLFWITSGHHVLTFTVMGAILGGWS
jgi:MFS family permease